MIDWLFRILLLLLFFGLNCISYGGDQTSVALEMVTNAVALLSIPCLVFFYFHNPPNFKLASWTILAGVFFLMLEALHIYDKSTYSPFVIKRFAYCGIAMSAYCLVSRQSDFKLKTYINILFLLYGLNQVVLGKILHYDLTSDTRTTAASEALYLVLPLVYFLDRYLKQNTLRNLYKSVAVLGLIIFLLHRSVISTAIVAVFIVFILSLFGKTERMSGTPILVGVFALLLIIPVVSSVLPQSKLSAFTENISGILSPKEDNTGSWRYEQSIYYWSKIIEKPLLGWRYEGYDKGEIMEEENFAEKGTYIHSQYIDMLYNYGVAGLAVNLIIILTTLYSLYRCNARMSTEQVTFFAFISSGLIYGISYQLPVYYWVIVGIGMFYGLHHQEVYEEAEIVVDQEPEIAQELTQLNLSKP
jgi:O-antigen ligase